MAIVQHTITSAAWVPISSAGQSDAVWLDEGSSVNSDTDDVRIVHGAAVPVDADFAKGKRVYIPKNNIDVLTLSADTGDDIFYAPAIAGAQAVLTGDVLVKFIDLHYEIDSDGSREEYVK